MNRKIYLVKKDPTCKKADIEWLQLSGREFFRFLRSSESQGRYFIRLRDDISFECDDIYIEATLSEYREWRVKENAHNYLKRTNKDYETLSFDAPIDSEENTLHDLVGCDQPSVEDDALRKIELERINFALESLSPDERFIIDSYYLVTQKTDDDIAHEIGISHQAVNKKRKLILKKIFILVGCKIDFH